MGKKIKNIRPALPWLLLRQRSFPENVLMRRSLIGHRDSQPCPEVCRLTWLRLFPHLVHFSPRGVFLCCQSCWARREVESCPAAMDWAAGTFPFHLRWVIIELIQLFSGAQGGTCVWITASVRENAAKRQTLTPIASVCLYLCCWIYSYFSDVIVTSLDWWG